MIAIMCVFQRSLKESCDTVDSLQLQSVPNFLPVLLGMSVSSLNFVTFLHYAYLAFSQVFVL